MNHAKQPKLCTECEQILERQARAETARNVNAKYCAHRGAFAIVMSEGGWIIDWAVQTCAEEARALQKIQAANADMLAKIDDALDDMLPDGSPITLQ